MAHYWVSPVFSFIFNIDAYNDKSSKIEKWVKKQNPSAYAFFFVEVRRPKLLKFYSNLTLDDLNTMSINDIELSKINEKSFNTLENERKFDSIYDAIDKWSLPMFK